MAESGSLTVNVGGYDSDYSLYVTPQGDVSGKSADNTSSPLNILGTKGKDNWIYFHFDVSSIPEKAEIDSVSCRFRFKVYSITYMVNTEASLCSGTVSKASSGLNNATTSKIYQVSGGLWTRDELKTCRLKLLFNCGSGSSTQNQRRCYFYGADLTVVYTVNNEKFMLKLGGAWHDIARVFKKVNDIWVEQTELSGVVEDGVRYVNGGEYVAPAQKRTVTITGTGSNTYSYVTINGTKYIQAATVEVNTGDEIVVTVNTSNSTGVSSYCYIKLDGSKVVNGVGSYTHVVDKDCTIILGNEMSFINNSYSNNGTAEITTT